MIRVLLVDDQALVRSGFRIILESEPDIEVVGEAENGELAVALAAELRPDVICMDVEMPVLNGIDASRRILAANDDAAVLVLTTFGHEQYLFDALAAGVSGFLLKTSRAEQLIDAVHSLAAGNALLGPDVTRAVIERVAADRDRERRSTRDPAPVGEQGSASAPVSASAPAPEATTVPSAAPGTVPRSSPDSAAAYAAMTAAGLTEREREVLGLVAEGRSNGEIAAALFLGEATIKTHVSNLLQKLGVRDRIQAVVWAHTRS
ncbi:response regulator [Leucobacter sp. NPDC058333]|uniref:response regulator n=1 Tax=Leucobacter sp. NPDC058333 TaxID=3346450 RepID=UPI003663AAA2